MKILVYGINYSPEITGIGKYTGELCSWLVDRGHQVKVVTTPPYYPEWKVATGYHSFCYKAESLNKVAVLRCPVYVPKKPTTVTRLLHLFSFSLSSFPVMLWQYFWKPELVLVVEPTFFCTPTALFVAKLSGSRCILHIQDYELNAMLGLGLGGHGVFSTLVETIERFIMQRFDAISTISYSMMEIALFKLNIKIDNKTELKIEDIIFETRKNLKIPIYFFPNWVDVATIRPQVGSTYFRDLWGISPSTKVVLYSGNMGKKQGLELVLLAAQAFKGDDVLFVMVGEGVACANLKQCAQSKKLSNVRFFPLQPYQKLSELLAFADIHLVIQKKGVADAVLPSKLSTILAVGGHAIVTAEKSTELGRLARHYSGIFHCIEPENLDLLILALKQLLKTNLDQPNQIARDYAINHLSTDTILPRFEQDIMRIVGLQ